LSSLRRISALKSRPILLRKPSSGPTRPVDSRVSISSISNWRPATIFQALQSQLWQANFL
jgi:hypothetical protein